MKPAKFDYVRAESIDQIVDALDKGDGEAIVLAGGQTLMPMLAMRLARPATVIDINNVTDLSGIGIVGDELVIMACTRQAEALASPLVREHAPLLAEAIALVGHQQTRNRGTVGGSLSHADPASEIPLAALALDASVSLRSVAGTRRVQLADYFLGPMMTARADNEVLVSVHFPIMSGGAGSAFHEVSERRGDFAVVAAAAIIEVDGAGICTAAALAIGGADATPRRIAALEDKLQGAKLDGALIRSVLPEIALAVAPGDDQHAGAAYRLRVATNLAERALLEAFDGARA
ncbi:MAG: xanthine dehydrogenase family protein subunit M [Rhodospirillaceae bacterium]|nr:xanthine dehydrogenase family protein subunit M [Rhodospirillaceae bacterium]MBT5897446.1 xanthine dehydrogenase family protein subunit M [Rhodospirillaceae bacterium]MBT6427490.1 xanthine dehydrogenase family protein subunit M [Rhodospirillaceae bacterium]